jgi:hypothetical protein
MAEQNGDIKLPPSGNGNQLTNEQRREFIDTAEQLLPPLDMADIGEREDSAAIRADYRPNGKNVTIYGITYPNFERYSWIDVRTSELIYTDPEGLFYATRGKAYGWGEPEEGDGVYEERVDVWEKRGVRLDEIIKTMAFLKERLEKYEELKAFVDDMQYVERRPLNDYFDEAMAILRQCGPDNFVPPPPPGSVYLI